MAWTPSMRETVALSVIQQILSPAQDWPDAEKIVEYSYRVADHFIHKSESHAGIAARGNHERIHASDRPRNHRK